MAQEKEYKWIKGKIFKRKDDTSPFNCSTAKNGKPVVKFTVRNSKKNGNDYDNTYYSCVAWEELAKEIVQNCKEKDSVLCKVTSKDREYQGKTYTDYTVYQLFREIKPAEQQNAWGTQSTQSAGSAWADAIPASTETIAAEAPQSLTDEFPLDFSEMENPTAENGKETDIPF